MPVIEGGVVAPSLRQNLLADVIGASALGVAAILAAVWDNGAQQVITTGINLLDRPRRITATVAASTAAHVKNISVTIGGLGAKGEAITEVLPAFTDNTPGTVTGVKVFSRVTSVTIPAHDGATANTSIGAAGAPAVANTTGILAAVTDNGAPQTITSGLNTPEVPRNITATAGGTAGDIKAIQVVITGTNAEDQVITETLPAFTVDTPGTVSGAKAFKTVTQVVIPAHDGLGATTAIGFGEVLGIGHRLTRTTVHRAYLNGVLEGTAPTALSSATVLESNTVDLNSALSSTPVVIELLQT
jgi:hypothetical protein